MLVKCWQAALVAALMVLSAGAAQAQEQAPQSGFATGYAAPDCCKQENGPAACPNQTSGNILKVNRDVIYVGVTAKGECCKSGACCADKKGECGKECACCKDKGCACAKSKSCECSKKESCACCKDKVSACCKGQCQCCGAAASKQAKQAVIHRAIIVHVPVPMMPIGPVCGGCIAAPGAPVCGAMASPLPPLPPMMTPPGLLAPTLTPPAMQPRTVALPPPPPPACCPCPAAGPMSCPCPTAEAVCPAPKATSNVENCLSILGMAGDLACTYLHGNSLPAMCLSSLSMLMDLAPVTIQPTNGNAGGEYLQHPPQYVSPSPPFPTSRELVAQEAAAAAILPPPRPECTGYAAIIPTLPRAPVVPCISEALTPASTLKVQIVAKPYSDRLEVNLGGSSLSSKKMVVKVGDSEIALTRLDGQVRIRGDELRARADRVFTDSKARLVLEGNVVLSYDKYGQSARVRAEHIDVNLISGAVTVQSLGKSAPCTPVRYDAVGP